MIKDEYTRKSNELCVKANLQEFHSVIKVIITEILDSGYRYGIVDIDYPTQIEKRNH